MHFKSKLMTHSWNNIPNTLQVLFWWSSSIMVTVIWLGASRVIPVGSEDEIIVSINFSSPSNILSSVIGMLNVAVVCPAGNVTVYGPEV